MTFVAIGLTCAALVTIVLSSYRWPIKVAGSVIFAAALGFLLFFGSGPTILGGPAWFRRSPWWEVVLFVIMLLGMMCRYMTAAIEERRARLRDGVSGRRIKIRFDAWEFSYPLFVSVITFGGVLSAISTEGLNLTNAILSFQTGFFWQTILASRAPAPASTTAKAEPAPR